MSERDADDPGGREGRTRRSTRASIPASCAFHENELTTDALLAANRVNASRELVEKPLAHGYARV
jgi:hypothetical protein